MGKYNSVEFETFDCGERVDNNMLLTLEDIYEVIVGKNIKGTIDEYVNTLEHKKSNEIEPLKSELLTFCYAGLFGEEVTKEFLIKYSKMVLLEFNEIDLEELEEIKEKAKNTTYSAMVYTTILGNGITVLVPVTTTVEYHNTAFEQVKKYYENLLGVNADTKTKDLTYMCIVSSDDDCYFRKFPMSYVVSIKEEIQIEEDDFETDFLSKIESTKLFTEKREKFSFGNEKEFIKLFAINCNNMGYDLDNVIKYCRINLKSKMYSNEDIERSVRYIYRTRKSEFGSRQKRDGTIKNYVNNTPTLTINWDSKLKKFSKFLKPYINDTDDTEIVITYLKGLLMN